VIFGWRDVRQIPRVIAKVQPGCFSQVTFAQRTKASSVGNSRWWHSFKLMHQKLPFDAAPLKNDFTERRAGLIPDLQKRKWITQ
jgi:glucokinase